MININEVIETNKMIDKENLDVRTITLGISLLDCIDSDLNKLCDNVYKKITTMAKDLVATGEEIGKEFGIPIVNKRISVTPIALIGGSACKTPDDFVKIAQTFYPFGKLREPLADIRKGSLFNSYYFHTFNFKRFIKRVDFIFIGK